MGFNPKYAMWTTENWQGYAPDIGTMARRAWTLTLHCGTCRLAVQTSTEKIIARRGPQWSPWGKSRACLSIRCQGRMRLQAHDPRSNFQVPI